MSISRELLGTHEASLERTMRVTRNPRQRCVNAVLERMERTTETPITRDPARARARKTNTFLKLNIDRSKRSKRSILITTRLSGDTHKNIRPFQAFQDVFGKQGRQR